MKKNATLLNVGLSWFRRSLMFIFLLGTWCTAYAQINLIKDINETGDQTFTEFGILVGVDERLFFYSAGGLHVSDGTTAGTSLVYSFESIGAGVAYNGQFIFSGDDGNGPGLWKSDGTEAGTVKLKSLSASVPFPDPRGAFAIANNTVYFAGDDGVSGLELWKTDGTPAGTVRVKDIKPGSASANPYALTAVGNKLFFGAPSGNNKGIELWVSDGSTTGTVLVKDIYPGSNSSDPAKLTNVNGICYFVAKDGVFGKELWRSDGTAAGTWMVKDIRPGSPDGILNDLTEVNGILFFQAHDGVHGKELWKSDGTAAGTVLVKDITPGPSSSATFATNHLSNFIEFNNLLYFVCFQNGHRLWRSDGTAAGTYPLSGNSVTFMFIQPDLTVFGNHLYFLEQFDWDITELWRTDGTVGGTTQVIEEMANFDYGTFAQLESSLNILFMVTQPSLGNGSFGGTQLSKSDGTEAGTSVIFDDMANTVGSGPRQFTHVDEKIFFAASTGDTYDYNSDLFITDGTTTGTQKVKDFYQLHDFVSFNNNLLFGGLEPSSAGEGLWMSDGTESGTQKIKDVDVQYVSQLGTEMLFSGDDGSGIGRELWKTDGTEAGTVLVKDIHPATQYGNVYGLTTLGSQVLFRANDNVAGDELWHTDGTTAGTTLLKDINPSGPSYPYYFTASGGNVYFVADDGVHGQELWKCDGTAAGTILLQDIRPGDASIDQITPHGAGVLFTAVDQYGSKGLWRSDGTTAGTVLVKDLYPGEELIDVIGTIENEIVILVRGEGLNAEIWKSDGTAIGTIKLLDLNFYATHNNSSTLVDGVLYFDIGYWSSAMWRTDGTSCGTFSVDYAYPIDIGSFSSIGGKVIFSGLVSDAPAFSNYGSELYEYQPEAITPCQDAAARLAVEETTLSEDLSMSTSVYPNPFRHQFVVNIPGAENTTYSMQVVNLNGRVIESNQQLYHNREYRLGAQWGSGIYIMKAVVDGKMVTSKLVKVN